VKINSRPESKFRNQAFRTSLDNYTHLNQSYNLKGASYQKLSTSMFKKDDKYDRFKAALEMNKSYSTSVHKKPLKSRLPPKSLSNLDSEIQM